MPPPSESAGFEETLSGAAVAIGMKVKRCARGQGFDFWVRPRRGESIGVEAKVHLTGARDLLSAVVQVATALNDRSAPLQGWLVVRDTRLSSERLREEWQRLEGVLRRDILERSGLIVLDTGERFGAAAFERHAVIVGAWKNAVARTSVDTTLPGTTQSWKAHQPKSLPTPKFFDVWKVLLSAWLKNEGFLPIHELGQRSAAAYPTVAEAVNRLVERDEIVRASDRSVRLRGWPSTTFAEVSPLLPALRKTTWYTDLSGRGSDPEFLMRRLRKAQPANVFVGGVEAARSWDPSFDLVGTPRLDLTVLVRSGTTPDLSFVQTLNPALAPTGSEANAMLAIHIQTGSDALFAERRTLSWADPSEVILDLAELRLDPQMSALIDHLRGGNP